MSVKLLYAFRHGETENEARGADVAHTIRDADLTDRGIAQVRHSAEELLRRLEVLKLEFSDIETIICSPTKRTLRTVDEILKLAGEKAAPRRVMVDSLVADWKKVPPREEVMQWAEGNMQFYSAMCFDGVPEKSKNPKSMTKRIQDTFDKYKQDRRLVVTHSSWISDFCGVGGELVPHAGQIEVDMCQREVTWSSMPFGLSRDNNFESRPWLEGPIR